MSEVEELKKKIAELEGTIQQSSTSDGATTMDMPAIYRLSPKLPPFWPDRPAVWFAQAESQFALAQITADATKFHYIVANLDGRYASEVEDIITDPPATAKYETLKEQLIHRLTLSEEQRVRQLLGREELGDRKPSQFLRHLRSLVGNLDIKSTLLRSLWLQRLPPHVQAILQGQSSLEPEQMAEMADRIMEIALPSPLSPINTVHLLDASTAKGTTVTLESLAAKIEALAKQVERLQAHSSRRTSRSSSHRKFNGSPHRIPASDSDVCYYHQRFKDKARRCVKPCSFVGNASGSQ